MILQSDNPYLNGIRVSPLLGTALFCVAAFGAWFLGGQYFPWAHAHGYFLPSLRDCLLIIGHSAFFKIRK